MIDKIFNTYIFGPIKEIVDLKCYEEQNVKKSIKL